MANKLIVTTIVCLMVHSALELQGLAQGIASSSNAERTTGQYDQVWFQPASRTASDANFVPRPIEKVTGKVAEARLDVWKVESLGSANDVFVPVDRLVWVEPAWTNEDAAEGMRLFAEAEYAQAIESLLTGIKSGPPVWQQQWLLVHLSQAAFAAERFGPVLQLVDDFSKSKPPETFLGLLPIQWTARTMPATALSAAQAKIDSPEPLVRLVAASWLLNSAENRGLAERILEGLSADRPNRVVSVYAEVLRWRRTPVPEIGKQADGWIRSVDRLPIMLQPGPLLTVGDRLQAAGDSERAKELFQSVVLLHKNPRPLADQARRELATSNK